jgi:Ca2+-binding RTX toxin-like protein
VAPGASVTTDFTLADSNSAGVTTTNATVSVVATAVATAPAIAGTVAGQSTTHEAAIRPFATASVSDVNAGASDTLTIAVSGEGGTLSGAGLVAVAGGYQLTGSASVITQELQALSFTANQGTPDTPSTTRFTLTDVSNEDPTPAIDATVSVTDTAPAVASKIGGLVAVQTTSDETSLKPFAGVTVTDPNGVPDSLAITLSGGDADGLLSGGGLSKTGAGSYALAATSAAALTAELDALVFTPTAHQVAPGASVTTQITLSDSNGAGFTTTAAASVIATASNDAPSIAGTVAGQTTQDNAAIAPFGSVTISDPDLGAADSLTISLIGADGSATDANGTLAGGGLVKTAAGTYVLAATNPAALTAELRALSFTPTEAEAAAGHTITTIFDLTATQNGLATVNSTTSVIVTPLDYIYGPIDGHATIEGSAGSDVITAFGWANTIYSNGGNDQIIAGQGTATVIGGAGNDQITLDGYYNVVTAGNGNDVVSGALGNTSISLGNGQDSVAVSGYYDTVALGNGQDTLTGPEGNATVTLGTGADTVTLGGDNNVVHAGSTTGTDFINAGTGSETVVGGNGTFVVLAGGDNDVITLGNGNDDVFTTPAGNPTLAPGSAVPVDAGAATVTTGSGNDTIILGGYGNTVNAGGGMNVIQGGTGNDLFFLPSAGQGFDRISGFTTENNDVLNLKSALAAAGWTGNSATLGSYLHVSDPATTAILSIAKGSGFTAVAQLQGVSGLTLATLQPHLTL